MPLFYKSRANVFLAKSAKCVLFYPRRLLGKVVFSISESASYRPPIENLDNPHTCFQFLSSQFRFPLFFFAPERSGFEHEISEKWEKKPLLFFATNPIFSSIPQPFLALKEAACSIAPNMLNNKLYAVLRSSNERENIRDSSKKAFLLTQKGR